MLTLAISGHLSHNRSEMSGIFFDLPSVWLLRRFRFLQLMLQTLPASLFRWLSAPAAPRRVHSRYNEAEFPSASQSACNKFDSALDESRRATDGVPSHFGALRPFDNWTTVKDQHELLFIRKTLTPPARWGPTQRKSGTFSGAAGTSEGAEEDVLAAGSRIFRKRWREKQIDHTTTQRCAAFATRAQA
jgi:hypothetical protein